jgi:ferredoxin
MKVAIVGTGLSAWAVFESLKVGMKPEDEITIIDVNKRYSNANSFLSTNGMKAKFGSAFAYDDDGSGLHFTEQSNFSAAHGGLSNTWGAGIRIWDRQHLDLAPIQTQEIYDAAKKLLQKIPFSGDASSLNLPLNSGIVSKQPPSGSVSFESLFSVVNQFGNSFATRTGLAVCVEGTNACRGCGECLKGCPYGSIFETSRLFDESLKRSEFKFIEGIVRDLQESDGGTTVFYETQSQAVESLEFDRVYLCAGAIGTPAILMRSKLLPNQVTVADSQAFYFIGLSYFKKNKKIERFALSQATIASSNEQECEFICSLYECNSDVRNRISELIASKLFGLRIKPPKFIDKFLFMGIGFIDSSKSGSILLNLDQDTGEISISSVRNLDSRREVKKALKCIASFTRKSKMYTFSWLHQLPSPGAGFHSGASMPAGGDIVSKNGYLKSLESVSIADVSILPFIKPGPHTFTSMAINYAITSKGQN